MLYPNLLVWNNSKQVDMLSKLIDIFKIMNNRK